MAKPELSVVAHDVHVSYRAFGGRRDALNAARDENLVARALGRMTRHVGTVTEIPAVRGVSFVAHRGESIGIIGRNGSGKSTLLRAIAGLIPTESGEIYVGGEIALLGVGAALVSSLSGERNIMIGGLAQGLTRHQIRRLRDEIVEFAGIGDFVHLPMSTYSTGMSSRLKFAISAAVAPDVLIIDEALATGDAEFKERSAERIDEIRQQAGTVFLVSHSSSSVRSMCERAIWLDAGTIRQDGPVDEICDAYDDYVAGLKTARRRKV